MKKALKYLLAAVLISSTVACKSDKKMPDNDSKQVIQDDKKLKEKSELLDKMALKVKMDFETDKEGLFQIKFRHPDKTIKPIIQYHNVKEVNKQQIISGEYDLEHNDFPEYVQFILGVEQIKKVKINEIKLITNELIIKVNKNNLKDFIYVSKYIDFDPATGILTTKKIDNVHLPAIMLNKRALDSLAIFY